MGKKGKCHWYRLERPIGTKGGCHLAVPVGLSNRYQWKPKAPVEKPGVLRRGHWSRLRGTGWETGAFGPSQPVPKARFLVVLHHPRPAVQRLRPQPRHSRRRRARHRRQDSIRRLS